MSDSGVAQLLGSLFSVVGLLGGWAAWANDWTLFVPFAAVLVLFGVTLNLVAWSWRRENRNSGPGSARLPAR